MLVRGEGGGQEKSGQEKGEIPQKNYLQYQKYFFPHEAATSKLRLNYVPFGTIVHVTRFVILHPII
jgi:hypothetical protein